MRTLGAIIFCVTGLLGAQENLTWDRVPQALQMPKIQEFSADLHKSHPRITPWTQTLISLDSWGRNTLEPTFGLQGSVGNLRGEISVGSRAPWNPGPGAGIQIQAQGKVAVALGGFEDMPEEILWDLQKQLVQAQARTEENQSYLEMIQTWSRAAEADNTLKETRRVWVEEIQILELLKFQRSQGNLTPTAVEVQQLKVQSLETELRGWEQALQTWSEALTHTWFPGVLGFSAKPPVWDHLTLGSGFLSPELGALRVKQFQNRASWVAWEREGAPSWQWGAQWSGEPGEDVRLGTWAGQITLSWKPQPRPARDWRQTLQQQEDREFHQWTQREARQEAAALHRRDLAALQTQLAKNSWLLAQKQTREAQELLGRQKIPLRDYFNQRQAEGQAWLQFQRRQWEEALAQAQVFHSKHMHYSQWHLKKEEL